MDLLMVTELFPPKCSGGGWSTYHLAKALDETDEVDVTVLAVNQEEVKDEHLEVETVSVPRLPNEVAYYRIYQEISKRKDDYDVVQGQHSLSIPPLGMVKETPTVGVIRGYWPVCIRPTMRDAWGENCVPCGSRCLASSILEHNIFFPYKLFNHHLRSSVLTDRVDFLSARSEFVEERLNESGFDRTGVFRNFVPEGFADGVEAAGEGDLLFVGNITPEKGPQLVVEESEEILQRFPEKKIVFLGDGRIKEKLVRKVAEKGLSDRIEFRGRVSMEEVKSRMKGASAVLCPSLWHEPLARVLVESHALGTPVVTTDRGGNPELADPRLVFDPDTGSFADKVEEAVENRDDMGMEAPEDVEVVEGWKKLYNELVSEGV